MPFTGERHTETDTLHKIAKLGVQSQGLDRAVWVRGLYTHTAGHLLPGGWRCWDHWGLCWWLNHSGRIIHFGIPMVFLVSHKGMIGHCYKTPKLLAAFLVVGTKSLTRSIFWERVYWLVLCQLNTNLSNLREGNLNRENTCIKLTMVESIGYFPV